MKKWQVILGTMLALVVSALAPLTALALSGDETTAAAKPTLKGGLAIVAPRGVAVGKEMSLGAFLREDQEPVPGVGVWALTKDSAESLKQETDAVREKFANSEEPDYEALLGNRGSFVGKTGVNGKLLHSFGESGNYVLVAAKKGYVPDFSPLAVRDGGGNKPDALAVSAPKVSPPGESVTITVTEKGSGEAVKEAGVWALNREQAEELKVKIGGIKATDNASGVDVEALLNGRSIFLGRTNGTGEVKHTFKEEGVYAIVAFKKGYLPGFSGIAIKNALKALSIKAPQISPVGESVTIGVSEKGSGDAVNDAGVWALTPAQAEELKSKFTAAGSSENATGAVDAESILKGRGFFLGTTHGNGELKYTFDKAGRYILVTVKKGYIPGYTGIGIVASKPSLKPSANVTGAPKANMKPALTPKSSGKPGITPKAIERPNQDNNSSIKSNTEIPKN